MSAITHLGQFLDALTETLSPEVARKIVALRTAPDVQARAEELAEKANESALTPAEKAEYKKLVEAVDIVSIIQGKARRFLSQHGPENGTESS